MEKLNEIKAELKYVFGGRNLRLLDSLLPVLVYVIVFSFWGLTAAWRGALAVALLIAGGRLYRKESLVYVLAGAAGVALAVVLVLRSGEGGDFFLPGLVSGGLTVLACIVSVVVSYPLVGLTSAVVRRWPLGWIRHPKVLPAYNEVTIAWALAFGGRLAVEFWFYARGEAEVLGALRLFLGWPFILALLVATYLYGTARLRSLGGPGVDEYREGKAPPWKGQQRGF